MFLNFDFRSFKFEFNTFMTVTFSYSVELESF